MSLALARKRSVRGLQTSRHARGAPRRSTSTGRWSAVTSRSRSPSTTRTSAARPGSRRPVTSASHTLARRPRSRWPPRRRSRTRRPRAARAKPTRPCGLTGAAPASTPVTSWMPWSRARRSTSRRAAVDVSRSSPIRFSESLNPNGGPAGRRRPRGRSRVSGPRNAGVRDGPQHLVGNADAGVGQAREVLDPVDARSEGVPDAGKGVGMRQDR